MRISRRGFLRQAAAAAVGAGLGPAWLGRLEEAMAAGTNTVVWVSAASCSGCSVSASNYYNTSTGDDFADMVAGTAQMAYHSLYMAAAGEDAGNVVKGLSQDGFILIVEGAIPTGQHAQSCVVWEDITGPITAESAVMQLAQLAEHVICAGTCSSHGGVVAAGSNPTGSVSVSQLLTDQSIQNVSLINVPGCPVHPDRLFLTLADLIANGVPTLDSLSRPAAFYEKKHCWCGRQGEPSGFGEPYVCLYDYGCKGEGTHCDCEDRGWFNDINCFCNRVNAPCQGCVEATYPDVPNDPHWMGEDYITPMLVFPGPTAQGVFMTEQVEPVAATAKLNSALFRLLLGE